jgi:hypothetical protein
MHGTRLSPVCVSHHKIRIGAIAVARVSVGNCDEPKLFSTILKDNYRRRFMNLGRLIFSLEVFNSEAGGGGPSFRRSSHALKAFD